MLTELNESFQVRLWMAAPLRREVGIASCVTAIDLLNLRSVISSILLTRGVSFEANERRLEAISFGLSDTSTTLQDLRHLLICG
jgi:hypothetical protein